MNTDDPRRLFESDDAPAGLRNLLQHAHQDALPSGVVEQLVGAAEVRAAMPARPPVHVRCASWARRAARRPTRFLLAAVVAGGGAALWYWGTSSGSGSAERAALRESPAQTSSISADHSVAQAATAPPAPAPEPQPSVAASPAVPTRTRSTGVARPGRPSRGPSAQSTETETVVSVETGVGVAGGDEFRLLQAARRAVADHPEQALRLTDEHRRRFPQGMLGQERDAIAIEALADLGRDAEARSRYQAFRAAYPQSPYRSRVERALARSDAKP